MDVHVEFVVDADTGDEALERVASDGKLVRVWRYKTDDELSDAERQLSAEFGGSFVMPVELTGRSVDSAGRIIG